MTQQEMLDQLIRLQLGELMVQIAVLKAQNAEMEIALAAAGVRRTTEPMAQQEPAAAKSEIIVESKPNGRHEKRVPDGG